ncbi:MAG: AhpC/TSA family protein [Rikenellaceae bacterium]|nr:AhpC/TSA family protein [Rikenellaceae bacterium]
MKKMMWAALSAVVMMGCAQQPQFAISGQVADMEGQWIYLCNRDGAVDSTKVEQGAFRLEGVVDMPQVLYVVDNSDVRAASVAAMAFIEEGEMTFEMSEEGCKVTGTPANDAYNAVTAAQQALFMEYRNPETSDERRAAIEVEFDALTKDAYAQNKTNLYGVVLLQNEAYSLSADEIEAEIATFPEALQQIEMMQRIAEMAQMKRKTEVGQPYIDFAQNDKEGTAISLKSVVENPANKYVLLDFWASWCGPCMAEVPHLKEAYDAYKGKGFEIFGVSLDNNAEAWQNAVTEKQLNWLHVSDLLGWQNAAAAEYGVRSIPANYLIDCATGQIVAVNLRGEEVKAKVAELLQ